MTSELYVSTSCLRGYSYTETLDMYEQAGIEAVELGYCPDEELMIDDIVEQYPFDFTAHNYFFPVPDEFVVNLASPDDSIRERSISYVRDGIDICGRHDIERYTIHSGFRVDPDEDFRFEAEEVPPASSTMETFISSMENILSYAENRGVSVAIENNVVEQRHIIDGEPVVLLADTAEFKQLLERVDLDILLDVGHLKVASETLGFDRENFLSVVAPHVTHVHLHTNNGRTDQHRAVELGSWAANVWQRFVTDAVTTIEAQFDDAQAVASHVEALSRY